MIRILELIFYIIPISLLVLSVLLMFLYIMFFTLVIVAAYSVEVLYSLTIWVVKLIHLILDTLEFLLDFLNDQLNNLLVKLNDENT
ncbi:hypothetical protein SAMN04488102_10715 [Alkalibacterium subtropicum]|uniref:Uncharacterized protein n=1 Tax=Alkalibacterium subtropicum TaxID=753702 RepID=A0A1I1J788_9LACT|nr:hypothetical protein SAMN04488102_10715 [Alkalibacterium subtropicum]